MWMIVVFHSNMLSVSYIVSNINDANDYDGIYIYMSQLVKQMIYKNIYLLISTSLNFYCSCFPILNQVLKSIIYLIYNH